MMSQNAVFLFFPLKYQRKLTVFYFYDTRKASDSLHEESQNDAISQNTQEILTLKNNILVINQNITNLEKAIDTKIQSSDTLEVDNSVGDYVFLLEGKLSPIITTKEIPKTKSNDEELNLLTQKKEQLLHLGG